MIQAFCQPRSSQPQTRAELPWLLSLCNMTQPCPSLPLGGLGPPVQAVHMVRSRKDACPSPNAPALGEPLTPC